VISEDGTVNDNQPPVSYPVTSFRRLKRSKEYVWIHAHGRARVYVRTYVSKSLRTGRLERELQMIQLSATRCSCTAILWVRLVSFAAITLRVASQQVFVVVYFVIDSVRKLFDTHSMYVYLFNLCVCNACICNILVCVYVGM
jgi:hypothetical protein